MYAENLKKIRKTLNLSVDKFARELGIPASTIWGYEGKKRVPSIELTTQLYRVFNVNLNWFVSGIGSMFNSDDLKDNFNSCDCLKNSKDNSKVSKENLRNEIRIILKEEGIIK